MGTRSLTAFVDRGEEIAVMYRQFDGYPSGHGKDLANFLNGMVIVNGMGGNGPDKIANGMDCLAAQVVAHFKEEPGNIYLMRADTRDAGEDYLYTITGEVGNQPLISIYDAVYKWDENNDKGEYNHTIDYILLTKGQPSEILEWINHNNED